MNIRYLLEKTPCSGYDKGKTFLVGKKGKVLSYDKKPDISLTYASRRSAQAMATKYRSQQWTQYKEDKLDCWNTYSVVEIGY